ncbi:hypothetical protein ALC56_01467 [Trachymyrmex septentrionalis]|uniref:Uncharacterized protein n=1 Tax=Trachymyrmex septentrionalis TaxID=34720 RepID=A0A195FUQ2_9HYME|nr:hypothetical protein ALC56_01467 [Trachymyrmex septentrionalis]
MIAMLKSSAKYNRRAAIIVGLRAGGQIYGFRIVQRRFQYASEEESLERTYARTPAIVERAQALISDDPGQSLRKLASITTSIYFGPRNWSVVERVTNKSRYPNVTLRTAIEAAFVDIQRYVTACVSTLQTKNRSRHSS